MYRRYLVALVGALIGGVPMLLFGLELKAVIPCALGVAALLMAFGERLGLVPASEDIGRPTSLFTDEEGRRR